MLSTETYHCEMVVNVADFIQRHAHIVHTSTTSVGWAAQPKARRAAVRPSRQTGRPTNGHYDYVHGART